MTVNIYRQCVVGISSNVGESYIVVLSIVQGADFGAQCDILAGAALV